jgi:hypothetical protein
MGSNTTLAARFASQRRFPNFWDNIEWISMDENLSWSGEKRGLAISSAQLAL